MPDNPKKEDELSGRLLGRGVNVGVVDVGWAQRQYARASDWVAERYAVLGDINMRYGTVDSRAAGSSASLPMAHGSYVRAESETHASDDDYTPTGGGWAGTAEAPRSREGVGDGGAHGEGSSGPTLQLKSKSAEHAPAPALPESAHMSPEQSAPPDSFAPLVSKERPLESTATPTVMRLAFESSSPTAGDTGAQRLTPETVSETVRTGAPSVSGALLSAREGTQEITGAETAASSEERSLPRVSSEPAATVMRAARSAESVSPIQPAAVVEESVATNGIVETMFADPDSMGTPGVMRTAGVGHPAAVHSTTGRSPAHAAETPPQTRLSAPEILQSPSLPLAARLVWRKSVGGGTHIAGGSDATHASMPYAASASPPSPIADAQTLYRAAASSPVLARTADEAGGATPALPPAPSQPSAGGMSLEQITEHVSRVLLRRIAVERERRGARRWL